MVCSLHGQSLKISYVSIVNVGKWRKWFHWKVGFGHSCTRIFVHCTKMNTIPISIPFSSFTRFFGIQKHKSELIFQNVFVCSLQRCMRMHNISIAKIAVKKFHAEKIRKNWTRKRWYDIQIKYQQHELAHDYRLVWFERAQWFRCRCQFYANVYFFQHFIELL